MPTAISSNERKRTGNEAPGVGPAREGRQVVRPADETGVWVVRAGCIGRGHAGKTALFQALGEGPVGDFFPSGLHVDVGDPKEVARMIREGEETQRFLQMSGLPPTLQASHMRYYLYDGDQRRVVFKMREVIGQVLTHTLPESSPEAQARYLDYLKSLLKTHVLWVVIPCPPPNPGPRDRRRYANDLRITAAYLREALRLRPSPWPASVALVVSKIDALYRDEEEARRTLTDELLREVLGPLVNVVDRSAHAADAAIFPVTAFGFGNGLLREEDDEEQNAEAPADDPFGGEPVWLLREGVAPQPFNLATLVLWSLLFGLLNQETQWEGDTSVTDLCRLLRDDLDKENHWLVPFKGRPVGSR
jgi:hypothetical protein